MTIVNLVLEWPRDARLIERLEAARLAFCEQAESVITYPALRREARLKAAVLGVMRASGRAHFFGMMHELTLAHPLEFTERAFREAWVSIQARLTAGESEPAESGEAMFV